MHTLIFVLGSISIGFILWNIIYFINNHCIVKVEIGLLTATDLLIILAVVGLILSFF